ncbi:MAG: DUF3078 domain-containing protein [Saprospiraceae bacterium]
MKKSLLFIFMNVWGIIAFTQSVNAEVQKAEDRDGWLSKGSLGLDLGQLLNINPYVGGGSNRLSLGGAIAFKANLKRGLLNWTNDFGINYSAQKIGSGTLSVGSKDKVPFEKALDILKISSNIAYKLKEGSHWAYSTDFFFQSQFSKSFLDSVSKKIYLQDLHNGTYNTKLVSKFLSPANFTLALGMKYQEQPNWYVFLSPLALKSIIITDQKIANLGVHGTKLKANSTNYKKSSSGIGALAHAGYTAKLFKKLNFGSELLLYSDYTDNPQNIDVTWLNNIGVEIFKGLSLSFKLDAYYDDNKLNNISDKNAVGGISGQGKRTNIIQQLILVYNRNF